MNYNNGNPFECNKEKNPFPRFSEVFKAVKCEIDEENDLDFSGFSIDTISHVNPRTFSNEYEENQFENIFPVNENANGESFMEDVQFQSHNDTRMSGVPSTQNDGNRLLCDDNLFFDKTENSNVMNSNDENKPKMVDAGCQTVLTIPFSFNFDFVDKQFVPISPINLTPKNWFQNQLQQQHVHQPYLTQQLRPPFQEVTNSYEMSPLFVQASPAYRNKIKSPDYFTPKKKPSITILRDFV